MTTVVSGQGNTLSRSPSSRHERVTLAAMRDSPSRDERALLNFRLCAAAGAIVILPVVLFPLAVGLVLGTAIARNDAIRASSRLIGHDCGVDT